MCVCPDCSITKFLNRILGLEVHKQNSLFQYFSDNFDYLIEMDKKEGKYDMGILGKEALFPFPCVFMLVPEHVSGAEQAEFTEFGAVAPIPLTL